MVRLCRAPRNPKCLGNKVNPESIRHRVVLVVAGPRNHEEAPEITAIVGASSILGLAELPVAKWYKLPHRSVAV